MICYLDKTFCTSGNCRKRTNCDRAYTEEVQKAADRWWDIEGESGPVALSDLSQSCRFYEPERRRSADES